MSRLYTYDPIKINDGGTDQMRFELGDTQISGGEDTAAMCDEEYAAMITKALDIDKRGWNWAKLLCLKAIMMRFSVEVDFAAGGASLLLSQRYDRWKDLYLRMQKTFQLPAISSQTAKDGGHYFDLGMQNNDRGHSYSPFGVPNRP